MATDPIPTLVTITPTTAGFNPVVVGLIDHSTYGPVGGSGGWQVVDRPKTISATQWYDRAPFQLEFECYLDNAVTQKPENVGTSVEVDCHQLQTWLDPISNTILEPTTLTLTGPVPGAQGTADPKVFVLFSISFLDAIRDLQTGDRTQQKIHVVFYEYNKPLASQSTAPSAVVSSKLVASNTSVITAKSGQTIAQICANKPNVVVNTKVTKVTYVKGKKVSTTTQVPTNMSYVSAFLYLNNIRDPKTALVAGKKYIVP